MNPFDDDVLLRAIFDLERRAFCLAELQSAERRVAGIIESLQRRRIDQRPVEAQLALLNRAVFVEHRLTFSLRGGRAGAFTLTGTLLSGEGNCLGLTTVYFLVASAVGMQIRPILYEGHIAVCDVAGAQPRLVEVTRGGAVVSARLAQKMCSKKGAGRILSSQELFAVHLLNHAVIADCPLTAKQLLETALELFPEYTGAWINLAAIHIKANDLERASTALQRVFELSPSGPYLRHAMTLLGSLLDTRQFELRDVTQHP